MFCDELPHGNLPPHMLIMACVLRYMLVKGHGEAPVLRKPELDAFLATAMSPELRNVTYLAASVFLPQKYNLIIVMTLVLQ